MTQKFSFIVTGIAIVVALLGVAFYQNPPIFSSEAALVLPAPLSPPTPTPTPTPTLAPPQAISIPKLGLTTNIELVGLDKNKRMDVPKDWDNVAWYQLGPKPGELGSAVIAGHLDSPTGPAIFYSLNDLELEDELTVTSTTGEVQIFEVVDKATYSDADFPISKVFSQTDARRLNLITCQGTFDRQTQNYSDRLVVFTQLKS